MTFFYDLNKRLAALASKQDAQALTESATAVAVESKFSKLAKEIGKNPKVTNPDAVAAAIGRKKYGQKAMTAKSIAGKKKANEGELGTAIGAGLGGTVGGLPGAALGGIAGHYLSKDKDKKTNEGTCPSCDCAPCKCNEGNAFTGALAKTPKGGKFKVGNKEFTDTSDLEEGFADMDAWLASREKEKGTGKFDKKERTLPGGMKATTYTRREEEPSDDDEEVTTITIKKKGRPKGKAKGPERVTKGAWKHKGERKEKTEEDLDTDGVMMTRPTNCSSESIEPGKSAEYNDEAGQAKDSLHTIVRHAKELERALRSNENMPEWVQEKIGQIKGMMSSVTDYILSTHERGIERSTGEEGITIEPVAERSKSQAQARMMAGAAHNPKFAKKVGVATKVAKEFNQADTGKDISKLPKKVKKTEEGAKPDFLDVDKDGNKKETFKKAVADKKEEKVDETTTSGSVAPVANAAPKSKGGMKFGQGVYESLDRQFKQALTESISVESKMAECGDGNMAPTLTIQADGEEAAKLMMLLKLAGLESQIPAACPTCGGSSCGCDEMVDENAPDWPTNTEKLDAEPNLRTYSGGLNGPKSTGQTTVPVVASQLRRQASMEESVKIERSLFKNWQQYKG